jgi:opacity protein-like surface antigen
MKYIAKSLVVASALIGASSASAMGCFDFGCVSPYVGAEYEWTRSNTHHRHSDSDGVFSRHSLAKSYNGGNIFLGGRWCDFGLELGYDFTGRKSRTFRGAPGARLVPGTTATFGTDFAKVKNRFDGWHVDLNGYMPVCDCLELIGSLGYGWVRPRFSVDYAIVDTAGTRLFTADDISNHNRYRGVFRLGAGAQYMVTECVGIRGMVRWKNINHRNRANSTSLAFVGSTRAKDAVSLSAGAFMKF